MSRKTADQHLTHHICKAERPVIAEFSTPDCTPCVLQERLVDGAVHDLRGTAEVVKVDLTENPEMADQFNIRSVPTVLVFHKGRSRPDSPASSTEARWSPPQTSTEI